MDHDHRDVYKFDTRYKFVTIHAIKYKIIDETTIMNVKRRQSYPELSDEECCLKNYNFSWNFINRPWLGDNPVYSND